MGIKNYMGQKVITKAELLGSESEPLGYEIRFESAGWFDEVENLPSYRTLKVSIEKQAPEIQMNITRCLEGIISFVSVGVVSNTKNQEIIEWARRKVVEALTSGYGYASLEDLCADYRRGRDPEIYIREYCGERGIYLPTGERLWTLPNLSNGHL